MNQTVTLLLIGAAGAIGALSRFGIISLARHLFGDHFPIGTLIVNVIGCFAIGMIVYLSVNHIPEHWKLVIGVGLLGSLTTFSAFGVDTHAKLNQGELSTAILNIALNMILGLGAVYAGSLLAKSVWPSTAT